MPNFYITTTLPYVNADPHIGFALEIVLADIIARQRAAQGDNVFFNTGTDEHGLKIYRNAEAAGVSAQEYVDGFAERFRGLKTLLNLYPELHFIRTTDANHKAAAQEFWKRCDANGDIYKKAYKIKYCVGCELEKTDSELTEGKCPLHPNLAIELIEEENYFFRWSKYQQSLLDFYKKHPDFVIPSSRFNEIIKFVEGGLEDFSVSRLKEKMPWGVPVPGDDTQVMYVWFDALVSYISTLGWPKDDAQFQAFWGAGAVQIAGKDNLRQQSAMWQGMLLSAGLPLTKHVIIHGFITSNGMKMSKSLGNVIDPNDIITKYGTDALRYFLAREITTFEDGDFTWERFAQCYESGLANGLGNLVSRTMKMAVTNGVTLDAASDVAFDHAEISKRMTDAFAGFNVKFAIDALWEAIASTNKYIEQTEPFKKIKTDPEAAKRDIRVLLASVRQINEWLAPFLPETSEKITVALTATDAEQIPRLFPRLASSPSIG